MVTYHSGWVTRIQPCTHRRWSQLYIHRNVRWCCQTMCTSHSTSQPPENNVYKSFNKSTTWKQCVQVIQQINHLETMCTSHSTSQPPENNVYKSFNKSTTWKQCVQVIQQVNYLKTMCTSHSTNQPPENNVYKSFNKSTNWKQRGIVTKTQN